MGQIDSARAAFAISTHGPDWATALARKPARRNSSRGLKVASQTVTYSRRDAFCFRVVNVLHPTVVSGDWTLATSIERIRRLGLAIHRRGGLQYVSSHVTGVILPRHADAMPESWADRVIAEERSVNRRPWHEQTSDQGPPQSRFSIAGLDNSYEAEPVIFTK